MARFTDRVAVITGGVSGIGRAVADRVVQEGGRVVLLDRDAHRWPEVRSRLGSAASFVGVDLADEAAVRLAAADVLETHPVIHALVNCAGVVHVEGRQNNPMFERGTTGWELLTAVNMRATAVLAIALRSALLAARGAVVNVSSAGQFGARDTRWIYDATKAAVLSITRSQAAAFASGGVRVNAVAPGATLTEMHLAELHGDAAAEDRLRSTELSNLLHRFAAPSEIASVICFLASDDASFMTGTTVPVDGGGQGR